MRVPHKQVDTQNTDLKKKNEFPTVYNIFILTGKVGFQVWIRMNLDIRKSFHK